MLRIIQSTSAASAAAYYTEGLKREDYYSRANEIAGRWHGLALEKLGLSPGEKDTPEQFTALLHNRHPMTGEKLTPRMNAAETRIPGWDFNFHAPKSLSLLHAITRDDSLVNAFRESVVETMADIEKQIATRVRVGGRQEDRVTGNLAWAEFLHFTARPVDGLPDCHLHIHAYVFNLTRDAVEERWKAAKIREIKDNAFFYEALFHSRLTEMLAGMGYSIARTAKGWEVEGLNEAKLLGKFSRRTVEIEKLAKELGITDPKEKDKLGAKTRQRKQKDLSEADLVKDWKSRLTPDEAAAISRTHSRKTKASSPKVSVGEAVDFAEGKLFEKHSVVARNRLYTEALKFGVGSVGLDEVKREMQRRGFIERNIGGDDLVTTVPRVVEEAMLIQRVREGRGKLAPLLPGKLKFLQDFLSKEQREAVRHILKSNDQVTALRGRAGTGKTTLLTEVRGQVERLGLRLFAFAPSAQASREVLRAEGFEGADTVARLLVDKRLQTLIRGQVILIDEAGTVGIRDLAKIMEIAGESTRIILSGDTGQHAPVGRGDAMRLLEIYAGLPIATIRQIRRQESEGYRKAVEAMADKDLKNAFSKLEDIDAIHEIADDAARYRRLALDYAQCLVETGVAPLVVAPTHAEGRAAVSAIRGYLTELGKLGPERSFVQYRDLKWEEVEKRRPENYREGLMVQLHQNVTGLKRGSILSVLEVDSGKTVWALAPDGRRIALDLKRAADFRVFETGRISFSKGDPLKITNGGKSANGRRLENGKVQTIKKIGKDGSITLANGVILSPDWGHFAHGYDTSHSSQGKTAREVFVAQSALSFRAGSSEQFYVSISRGKERLRIYTDDRASLQKAVGNSSRRLSALEFTGVGEELFMNGGLSGSEWTKRIAAGKAHRQENFASHVEKLAADRKLDPQQKISSFTGYLEMKRANITADGKSRSKGHPQASNPKKQGQKGMTTLKRVEMRDSTREKVAKPKAELEAKAKVEVGKQEPAKAGAKKPSKSKEAGVQRVENEVSTSNRHLKEVLGRTKRGLESIKDGARRSINFGKIKTTLGKLTGNPKTREAEVKQRTTPKPPAPKPAPPSPAIRRGR